jgi:hypothetical protein
MDGIEGTPRNAMATGQLKMLSQYRRAGGQPVVEPRQSALQRIQVGLIGLVVVLLFVSLANMVLDRVAEVPANDPMIGPGTAVVDKAAAPGEPLAELGVTPVAKEDDMSKARVPTQPQNMQQVPAPSHRQ